MIGSTDVYRELEAHRCYRGRRCPDHETVDIPPTPERPAGGRRVLGAQIAAARGFCPTCSRYCRDACATLTADYELLHAVVASRPTGELFEPVSGTRERPIPIRAGIELIAGGIRDELLFWDDRAVEVPTWAHRSPRRDWYDDQHRVHQAGTRLTGPRWDWWQAAPAYHQPMWTYDGEPAIDDQGYWRSVEIDGLAGIIACVRLHEVAQRVCGLGPGVETRAAVPCPSCTTDTLMISEDRETVRCARCPRPPMTYDDYLSMCERLLAGVA